MKINFRYALIALVLSVVTYSALRVNTVMKEKDLSKIVVRKTENQGHQQMSCFVTNGY